MEAQERGFSKRKLADLKAIYKEVTPLFGDAANALAAHPFAGYCLPDDRIIDAVYGFAGRTDLAGFSHTRWQLLIVHNPAMCVLGTGIEVPCCIHRPSENHMRDWPFLFDADEASMHRICEHGAAHPDIDHLAYIAHRFDDGHAEHIQVHECCLERCCEGLVP